MGDVEIAVKVASKDNELEMLRPFWTKLNHHPESDIDFVRMLATVRPEILGLYVVVGYRAAEPIAMMVGRLEHSFVHLRAGYLKLAKIQLKQIVFVRDGFMGEQSGQVITGMLDQVCQNLKESDVDRVVWSNVGMESDLEKYILSRLPVLRRECAGPRGQHWRTQLPDGFETFLGRRPKKHRYWLRRIGKVFETHYSGKVRYEVLDQPEHVKGFCEAAEQVAVKTYQRGLGAGFLDNAENRERLMLAAVRGRLKAYVARVENTPVAFWCGERIGGVMHLTWTGFDPQYRKFEVGTILYLKMVEDLIACGTREIDYGLGAAHYKERFGDNCIHERDLAIYAPGPKGYALSALRTLENLVNRAGKEALSWAKMSDHVKKKWRSRLAGKNPSSEECYGCEPKSG